MKTVYPIVFFISIAIFFVSPPVFADEAQSFDNRVTTPFVKRSAYNIASGEGSTLAKHGKSSKSQNSSFSPFSNTTTGILSAIGGGISVIGGAVFTWVRYKRKNSLFNSYLKQIEDQKRIFQAEIKSKPENKGKILTGLQEIFKKIQENAELASADKKIEESQMTVIDHKIERVLAEVSHIGS